LNNEAMASGLKIADLFDHASISKVDLVESTPNARLYIFWAKDIMFIQDSCGKSPFKYVFPNDLGWNTNAKSKEFAPFVSTSFQLSQLQFGND
jgi:hypothetical protein